ncbi:hypothetical protein ACFE04_022184 [Oxalis oulophora]
MHNFNFYVFVVNSIVVEKRMPLPDCFPQWMREKLGQYVSIRNPNGLSWMVSVVRGGNGLVYLGGPGWADLAAHHSLSCGHLLQLRLERPDLFDMIIWGQSAFGLQYPALYLPARTSLEIEREEKIKEIGIQKEKEPLVDGVVNAVDNTCTKIMIASDINGRQTIGIPLPFIRRNWAWFNNSHVRCHVVVYGEVSEECRISWHFRKGHWEAVICSGGWKYAVYKLNSSKGDVVEFKLLFDEKDKVHHVNARIVQKASGNGTLEE